jgi:hypothetical protein
MLPLCCIRPHPPLIALNVRFCIQALDYEAIRRRIENPPIPRRGESMHDEVYEDIIVATNTATSAHDIQDDRDRNVGGAERGGANETNKIVFIDHREEAAQWERDQAAKEPQRWEALPAFNPVRLIEIYPIDEIASNSCLALLPSCTSNMHASEYFDSLF